MKISGQYKDDRNRVEFTLPIITFEEEDVHFQYCPALDLTGYGKTAEEAQSSFDESLGQFFSYTINKGTLGSELEKLGWKVKKRANIVAPSLVDMINSNAYLADIFETKNYRKYAHQVQIPAFA